MHETESTINLDGVEPFAEGGQRHCFMMPGNSDVCIKINKSTCQKDFTQREISYLNRLLKIRGVDRFESIPQFWGAVNTTKGVGAAYELVRNKNDNLPAKNLSQILFALEWVGKEKIFTDAFADLQKRVFKDGLVIRDLAPVNIGVKELESGHIHMLYIDGFGHRYPFPQRQIFDYSKAASRWKMERLFRRFDMTHFSRLADSALKITRKAGR